MNREGAKVVAQILKTNKSITDYLTELDIVNNPIRCSSAEVTGYRRQGCFPDAPDVVIVHRNA